MPLQLADPARMNSSCYRVGVISVHTSAPQVALQNDLLSLAWFEVVAMYSTSNNAIDRISFEEW